MQVRELFARREELLLVLPLLLRRWREAEGNEWEVKDPYVRQVIADVVHLAEVDFEGHGEGLVLLASQLDDHIARGHLIESVRKAFDTRILDNKHWVLHVQNVTKHEQAKLGTYEGWTLSWRAVEIIHTLLKIAEGQLGRVRVHT